jgi:hypothetical protein
MQKMLFAGCEAASTILQRSAGETWRVNLPAYLPIFHLNRPLAHSGRAQAAIEFIAFLRDAPEDKIQSALDQTGPATFGRAAEDQQDKRYRMKR